MNAVVNLANHHHITTMEGKPGKQRPISPPSPPTALSSAEDLLERYQNVVNVQKFVYSSIVRKRQEEEVEGVEGAQSSSLRASHSKLDQQDGSHEENYHEQQRPLNEETPATTAKQHPDNQYYKVLESEYAVLLSPNTRRAKSMMDVGSLLGKHQSLLVNNSDHKKPSSKSSSDKLKSYNEKEKITTSSSSAAPSGMYLKRRPPLSWSGLSNTKSVDTEPETMKTVTCQCCYGEALQTATLACHRLLEEETTAAETRGSSPPETHHNLCKLCVTAYVREWLHGGNRNGVIRCSDTSGRVPCFCSNEEGCSSFIVVDDWSQILSSGETNQLNDRLTQQHHHQQQQVTRQAGYGSSNSSHNRAIGRDRRLAASAHSTTTTLVHDDESPPEEVKLSTLTRRTPSRNNSSNSGSQMSSCSSTIPAPNLARYTSLERAQHAIEELKTEAILRCCPTCDKTFVKEHGCNKVTCPNCLTSICYCCRVIVPQRGYDHFFVEGKDDAQQKLGRCPLWTDDIVDRRREQDSIKDKLYRMAQQMRSNT